MKQKRTSSEISLRISDAIRREQELCVAALDSGEYDNLSDAEWVSLCEELNRKQHPAQEAKDAEQANVEPGADAQQPAAH